MADQIINTIKFTDPNSPYDTQKYLVYYRLDDGVRTVEVEVTVHVEQMTDSEDLAELKAIANKRAAILKDTWTNGFKTLLDTAVDATNNGVVTL